MSKGDIGQQEIERLVLEFDKLAKYKHSLGNLIKPSFIGVGAGRCGTSAIFAALRHHSGCYLSPLKELNYFGIRDKETVSTGLTFSEYLSYFLGAKPGQLVGEISPAYLTFPDSLSNLKSYLPDVKIILTLRNPFDRFKSQFKHHQVHHSYSSFDHYSKVALDQYYAGYPNGKNWYEPVKNLYQSLFFEGVSALVDSYGQSKIHTVYHSSLSSNYSDELASLQRFLGLDVIDLPFERTNQSSKGSVDLAIQPATKEQLINLFDENVQKLSSIYEVEEAVLLGP